MTMQELDKLLTDKARELHFEAEWYAEHYAPQMSDLCRYSQRTLHKLIDIVRTECKTLDDVTEAIDFMCYKLLNEYKHMQSEHFEHFAELAKAAHSAVEGISFAIERAKNGYTDGFLANYRRWRDENEKER